MSEKPSSISTAKRGALIGAVRFFAPLRSAFPAAPASLAVAFDQILVSASSFLATVLVGRVCGQHELGVYGLAVSLFWLAAGIPNALVWTPYTAKAANLPPARRVRFAGSALVHVCLVALVVSALLLAAAMAATTLASVPSWFAPMCAGLAPFTLMMILREHARRYNLSHLRSRDLLALDVPLAAVQLLLLGALAYTGLLSAATAMIAVALSCGWALVWLGRHRSSFDVRPRLAAVHWYSSQRFGRWLLLVSLLWLVGDCSYRWLVLALYGTESLGQFSAAQNIVLLLNPILLTVTNLAQSLAAQRLACGGKSALRQLVARSTLMLGICSGAFLIGLAIFGGRMVELMFGPVYSGLGAVVASLCLGMFARIVAMPVDGAVIALEHGRLLVAVGIVRLSVIVGVGAPLIGWRGLEGVGYAMAASAAAGAAVEWWALAQEVDDARV